MKNKEEELDPKIPNGPKNKNNKPTHME